MTWLTTKLDFLDFTWKMYHTRSGLKEEKTLTKQDTNRSTNQTSNSPPFFSVHSLVFLIRYDTCTLRTTIRKRVFREEAAPALKIVYFSIFDFLCSQGCQNQRTLVKNAVQPSIFPSIPKSSRRKQIWKFSSQRSSLQ